MQGYPDVILRDTFDAPNFPAHHYMPEETAGFVKKIFALYFTGFEEVCCLHYASSQDTAVLPEMILVDTLSTSSEPICCVRC